MSKKEYRAAQQAKPIGEAGIAKCKAIVAAKSFDKVNEVAVDTYSASAVVAVYDALNEENKAKFAALSVPKAVSIAFKLVA